MSVTSATPSTEPVNPPTGSQQASTTNRNAYWYILPIVLSAIIFTIIPFIYTFYISLTNWGLYHFADFEWVGLSNYRFIFGEGSEFYPVLRWTFYWMILSTVINVGFGLFLALILNHPGLPERNIYRTLLIIPWALPFILLVQVWTGIFNTQGPINEILLSLGLDRITWLPTQGDPTLSRIALLLVNLWFTYPFFMTVGLAALQAIPRDLYEVADLDGAGAWSRFRDITMPFLRAAVMPLLITQAAFQFNNAGVIILFTQGLPSGKPGALWGKTDTLASYAYDIIYTTRDYGLAAAYAAVTFVMIAALIVVSALATKSFAEVD